MQTEEQKQRGRPGNEATKTVRIELELEREVSLGARKKKISPSFFSYQDHNYHGCTRSGSPHNVLHSSSYHGYIIQLSMSGWLSWHLRALH